MKTFISKKQIDYQKQLSFAFLLQDKMLNDSSPLSDEEIAFLRKRAKNRSPLGEFQYGIYLYVYQNDVNSAMIWWNKFYEHGNKIALWRASKVVAFLSDEFYELSIKFMRKSAKKGFELARLFLNLVEDEPYSFPVS